MMDDAYYGVISLNSIERIFESVGGHSTCDLQSTHRIRKAQEVKSICSDSLSRR